MRASLAARNFFVVLILTLLVTLFFKKKKNFPYFLTALVLANTAFLVRQWNKIGHPAHSYKRSEQILWWVPTENK